MNSFIIFGDVAINLDQVFTMREADGGVTFSFEDGSKKVQGVTIDEVMTAISAGQSRVAPKSGALTAVLEVAEEVLHRGHRPRSPNVTRGNDPQAMLSIGRRPD